jgi:hypothetical protein
VTNQKYDKLPPKEAESNPWDTLCVDLISPYKIKRKGKKELVLWCLTMIDPVTGWFDMAQIANKTAAEVADLSNDDTDDAKKEDEKIEDEVFGADTDDKDKVEGKEERVDDNDKEEPEVEKDDDNDDDIDDEEYVDQRDRGDDTDNPDCLELTKRVAGKQRRRLIPTTAKERKSSVLNLYTNGLDRPEFNKNHKAQQPVLFSVYAFLNSE